MTTTFPATTPPLRTGFTTGLCATACTRAALQAWLGGHPVAVVSVQLPDGEPAEFAVESCEIAGAGATCTVRKDGGDDPDVTHGASVGAKVVWHPENGVEFRAGEGVGTVTLPGLPLPVGEPAINPAPRRMMTDVVHATLAEFGMTGGATVEVFVPGGAEIAARTLNPRLGIVGGISIIGTTGRVRPFSAEAYIASINSAIDVAAATGCPRVVLNSGGRTEAMLRAQLPSLPPQAFVQYGNWIGEALAHLRRKPLPAATLGLMLGKAVKLAAGRLDTHSREGLWDRAFVAGLARECGYAGPLVARIADLTLARQLAELFPFSADEPLYRAIAAHCHAVCQPLIPAIPLELRLHTDTAGWLVHDAAGTRPVAPESQ
jgi:cobalt-precorrin-5B (C1)-methyltransferase